MGAVSGGMGGPRAPACLLGLVSSIKHAVSRSTNKHVTQLVDSQNPEAAEIRTGKSFRHLMPLSLDRQD